MRRYATQAGQAASHFKAAIRETTAPRQAHTLEQFRQAPAPGAVRFVVMNTDFLAGLAPQLLAGGRVILMMPAATAGSDARYRMPQSLHQAVRDELHCCIAGLLTIHDPARQPAWPGPGCATPKACSPQHKPP